MAKRGRKRLCDNDVKENELPTLTISKVSHLEIAMNESTLVNDVNEIATNESTLVNDVNDASIVKESELNASQVLEVEQIEMK